MAETLVEKIWTPENVIFDSEKSKIPYTMIGNNILLPPIDPEKLYDPDNKSIRHNQPIVTWLIQRFPTIGGVESIISGGKSETVGELKLTFPTSIPYYEKVDPGIFLSFYLNMALHKEALQVYLAGIERKNMGITMGKQTAPAWADRTGLGEIFFSELLGIEGEKFELIENLVKNNKYHPNLFIYLDCPIDISLQRIKKRAEEDKDRQFELEGGGELLTPDKINLAGQGTHKLIAAHKRFFSLEHHQKYLIDVVKAGIPLKYNQQGVTGEYQQALYDKQKRLPQLCEKLGLNAGIVTIKSGTVDFKDHRFRLAYVYGIKAVKCIDLINNGFKIYEDVKKGSFEVKTPYGTTLDFRSDSRISPY